VTWIFVMVLGDFTHEQGRNTTILAQANHSSLSESFRDSLLV